MHIVEAPLPLSLDRPEAWACHGMAEVERAVARETWGVEDTAYRAVDIQVSMASQRYARKVRLVAVEDSVSDDDAAGRVLGFGALALPTSANTHLAHLRLLVAPTADRDAVGRALLDEMLVRARAAGRSTVLYEVEFGPGTDGDADADGAREWVTAASGKGRVAADLPGVRLARSLGFECALVERQSLLELPFEPGTLEAFEAEARAAAGDAYRLHTWHGRIPEEWIDAYAALETALAADEPRGEQDVETDPWDAERVRAEDAHIAERGQSYVITAAEHVAGGELAGMTMLLYRLDDGAAEFAHQESTVVLRAHRGHRLGMLVKTVNARALLAERPGVRRIWTWNNEENPYMLAINVALGFRPAGGSAQMQLRLG